MPGPADGEDEAATGRLQIEVGPAPGAVGRAATVGRKRFAGVGAERAVIRLIALRDAPVAFVAVERELALRAALEPRVQRLEVLQDRGVNLAGVLEEDGPLCYREVSVFNRDAPDFQARAGIGPGERVLGAGGIQFLPDSLLRPHRQQFIGGVPVIDEGKGQRAGPLDGGRGLLRAAISQGHITEPELFPVRQRHLGVGPIGLVPANAVAGIADLQRECVRTGQINDHLAPRSAIAHYLGLERHLVTHLDREAYASLAVCCVVVVIEADHSGEAFAGGGKPHFHFADGMAVEAARVFLVADAHPFISTAVLGDRVMVREDIQARFRREWRRLDRFGW